MKLIFAIVQNDDSKRLIRALVQHRISVTRISTTGGFLHGGQRVVVQVGGHFLTSGRQSSAQSGVVVDVHIVHGNTLHPARLCGQLTHARAGNPWRRNGVYC